MEGRVSVSVEAPEGNLVISGPLVVLRRFLLSVGCIPPTLDGDDEGAWPWPPAGPAPLRLRR